MNTHDPLTRLEEIVAAVERDLLHALARYGSPSPELARDTTGRYLLLDAYAALATAHAARDQLDAAMLLGRLTRADIDQLEQRRAARRATGNQT